LTVKTGANAVVLWQASQALLVLIWVAILPAAVLPLWQPEQLLVMPL
jgi:hypothetical protein